MKRGAAFAVSHQHRRAKGDPCSSVNEKRSAIEPVAMWLIFFVRLKKKSSKSIDIRCIIS